MTLDYRSPMHEPKRKRRGSLIVWSAGILFVLLLLISILLPSLGHAREAAQRVKCASCLREIGYAATQYANDHQGQLPSDLPTILENEDITPEVFTCPSSHVIAATGATTQQVVATMLAGDHISYAWTGAGLTSKASADIVLAFDLEMHTPVDATASTSGINVLLGDDSVTFVNPATGKAIWAEYHAGVRPIRLSTCTASAATMPASSP